MKKNIYILIILITISSCKKDESNPTSGDIIGTWSVSEMNINLELGYYTNYPEDRFIEENINFPVIPGDQEWDFGNLYFEFKDNGILIQTEEEINGIGENGVDTSTWIKSGNTLTINNDGTAMFTITKLNSSSLIFNDFSYVNDEDTSSRFTYNPITNEYIKTDTIDFDKSSGEIKLVRSNVVNTNNINFIKKTNENNLLFPDKYKIIDKKNNKHK